MGIVSGRSEENKNGNHHKHQIVQKRWSSSFFSAKKFGVSFLCYFSLEQIKFRQIDHGFKVTYFGKVYIIR